MTSFKLKFSFILPTVTNVTPTVARVNIKKLSSSGKNHHVTLTNSIPANRLKRGNRGQFDPSDSFLLPLQP